MGAREHQKGVCVLTATRSTYLCFRRGLLPHALADISVGSINNLLTEELIWQHWKGVIGKTWN